MLMASISSSVTMMAFGYLLVSSSQWTERPVQVVVAEIDDYAIAGQRFGAQILGD